VSDVLVEVSIQMRGIEVVQKRFEDLASDPARVSGKTIYDIVWNWRNELAKYPPPLVHGEYEMEWASEKQRRYVMMMMRLGELQVPYKRTGAYGWNWRVRRDLSVRDGVAYLLYNNMDYAAFVAGGPEGQPQYHLHQGRWLAFEDGLEAISDEMVSSVNADVAMVARQGGF
jgi:hypothetical protein